MRRFIHEKCGVTLIELVVSSALVALVVTLVFSFHIFGTRTFSIGDTQSDVQSHVRLGANRITRVLRNAITVEVLASVPTSFDEDKKYVYVENNSLKLNNGPVKTDLTGETPGGLNVVFTMSSEDTMLDFSIQGGSDGISYTIDSEVYIQNMGGGSIAGTASGLAVVFGPLTESESVAVDTETLDTRLLTLNDLTDYIISESLFLPSTGTNDSDITWSSGNTAVIEDNGAVHRPGITESDAVVTLTATITNGSSVQTRDFIFTVLHRTVLTLNTIPPPDCGNGNPYSFQFTSTGGYEGYYYTVTSGALPSGLSLNSNSGILAGTPTSDGTYTFTVTVEDIDDIENEPNDTDSHEFSIVID